MCGEGGFFLWRKDVSGLIGICLYPKISEVSLDYFESVNYCNNFNASIFITTEFAYPFENNINRFLAVFPNFKQQYVWMKGIFFTYLFRFKNTLGIFNILLWKY